MPVIACPCCIGNARAPNLLDSVRPMVQRRRCKDTATGAAVSDSPFTRLPNAATLLCTRVFVSRLTRVVLAFAFASQVALSKRDAPGTTWHVPCVGGARVMCYKKTVTPVFAESFPRVWEVGCFRPTFHSNRICESCSCASTKLAEEHQHLLNDKDMTIITGSVSSLYTKL